MEISVHYRFYKKHSKYICLRSLSSDGDRHFTLISIRPKDGIGVLEWNKINYTQKQYFEKHNWQLTFTPHKACNNCTYGYFDSEFEDLIYSIRKQYPNVIETEHDILEDPNFDAKNTKNTKEAKMMFAHISHSRGNNTELSKFLLCANSTTQIKLNITERKKRND